MGRMDFQTFGYWAGTLKVLSNLGEQGGPDQGRHRFICPAGASTKNLKSEGRG